MRKGRFWFLLITDILSILLIVFTIIYHTRYDIYLYIIAGMMLIPNFTMRNTERSQLVLIIGEYAMNADAFKYYDDMVAFYKTLYLTKKARKMNNIILAMIKIDMGEIDEALKMLTELESIIDKANFFNKYNYYRAWCSIYYEKGQANHYKILLEELKKIIEAAKQPTLRDQMITNYRYIEAKYFIMNGIYLDKARTLYEDTLSNDSTTIMRLVSNYYLGVIYAKENNISKSIEYFKKVAFSDKKLHIVNKAIKYIEALEK